MSSPSDKPPVTPVDDPASATVELVGFGPSLNKEGPIPFSESEAAAAAWRIRRRRIWIGGVILLVVAGYFLGPVVYRAAKGWRADGLARAAEAMVNRGATNEAVATVRTAYLMAPNNIEVLRAMALVLTSLNAPSAMTYWGWLLESSSATELDRLHAAECALHQGSYSRAGDIIGKLMVDYPKSAPALLMAARYYAAAGAPSQAVVYATRSVAADPAYKPAAIFLAIQELPNSYLHQSGVDALLQVAEAGDAYSVLALEALAQEPSLQPTEIDRAVALMTAHPLHDENARIAMLILQLRQTPERRAELLDAATAAHRQATVNDLILFANWLNSINESARVLDVIPPDSALSQRALFMAYLDALGNLQRWSDLEALLTRRQVPLEQPYTELYLYRCARELGDAEAADLHWRTAQVTAAHNAQESMYLADYAANLGDNERAEGIYRLLIHDLIVGRSAYLGLLRVDWSKSTPSLAALLDEMAARWPDDEGIQNDDVYYNLLLHLHVPEMEKRADALVQRDPYSTAHITDVALARLRQDDAPGAMKILENSPIDWNAANPSSLAVFAATMEANGFHPQALQAVQKINRAQLRPEEIALIRNIR